MQTRRPLLIGGGVVVAVVVAVAAAWFLFFTPDSPEPLTLSQVPTTAAGGGQATGTTAAAGTGQATGTTAALAGIWKVATGSEAGYRVREKLTALPASSDAVGRTPAVSGQVRVEEAGGAVTVVEAGFSADLTKLASDSSNRDNRIRNQGLESNRFPMATFTATEALRLGERPAVGQAVKLSAVGDLTIHGVTKRVTIPIDAQLTGTQIELVGSYKFPMSDFAIDPPNVAGVVTVESDATLEFRLLLEKG